MNKIEIIGNLTRDPQLRTVNTANGTMNVCDLTVAVNRRRNGPDGKPLAEFYRVSAWGKLCKMARQGQEGVCLRRADVQAVAAPGRKLAGQHGDYGAGG